MQQTTFDFTIYSSNQPLNKTIELDQDGKKRTTSSMYVNHAKRASCSNITDFSQQLSKLCQNNAIGCGVFDNQYQRIGSKRNLKTGELARTKHNMSWPNTGGLLAIDCDDDNITLEMLEAALYEAVPALRNTPALFKPSSSAGVYNPLDATFKKSKNKWHGYFLVSNAGDIPLISQIIYDRLWLNGHGYSVLTKPKDFTITLPHQLERCIIDSAIYQNNRIMFEAEPETLPPLKRDYTPHVIRNPEGLPLNIEHVTPLTQVERKRKSQLVIEAKEKLQPEIDLARDKYLKGKPSDEVARIKRNWELSRASTVPFDTVIHLANGTSVTVRDIVNDVTQYNFMECRDPLEPDYRDGAICAILYLDSDKPKIQTQAHGGRTYILQTEEYSLWDCKKEKALKRPTKPILELEALKHAKAMAKPFYQSEAPVRAFDGIKNIAKHVFSTQGNFFIQSGLGTGKTQQILVPLANNAFNENVPLLVINNLRKLSSQLAGMTGTALYSYDGDDPKLEHLLPYGSEHVTVTINSLLKDCTTTARDAMATYNAGYIVIDEAASVAQLLFSPDSTMSSQERDEARQFLHDMAQRGIRFILLDADYSIVAQQLAKLLSCEYIQNTSHGDYDLPSIEINPVQTVVDELTDKTLSSAPLIAEIKQCIANNVPVAIAVDSRKKAQALERILGSGLTIHSENSGEEQQLEFVKKPENIVSEQFLVYSPVLNTGFSCTTPTKVFAFFSSGVLQPQLQMQILRRFRNVIGGIIKICVSHRALHPQNYRDVYDIPEDSDNDNTYNNITRNGVLACDVLTTIHQRDPYLSFIGHASLSGYQISFNYDNDVTYSSASKLANRDVKDSEIDAVFDAKDVNSIDDIKASGKESDCQIVKRFNIKDTLNVGYDDVTRDIVGRCLNDKFLTRVKNARALHFYELYADYRQTMIDTRNNATLTKITDDIKYNHYRKLKNIFTALDADNDVSLMADSKQIENSINVVLDIIAYLPEVDGGRRLDASHYDIIQKMLRAALGKRAVDGFTIPTAKSSINQKGRNIRAMLEHFGYSLKKCRKNGEHFYVVSRVDVEPYLAKKLLKLMRNHMCKRAALKQAFQSLCRHAQCYKCTIVNHIKTRIEKTAFHNVYLEPINS